MLDLLIVGAFMIDSDGVGFAARRKASRDIFRHACFRVMLAGIRDEGPGATVIQTGTSRRSGPRTARACAAVAWLLLALGPPAAAGLEAGIEAYEARNWSRAFRNLAPLAGKGEPKAQFHLGQMHRFGWGVREDLDEATRLIRSAASAGDADAQLALAQMVLDEEIAGTPAEALTLSGRVVLQAVIDEKGEVRRLQVPSCTAVAEWKYGPALRDGKPIAVTFGILMEFDS